jgi:hypothetical protein
METSQSKSLSPAARTVMDAATNGNFNVVNDPVYKQCIAAALRAAVKQTRKRKVLKTLWVTMVKGPIYCLESDLLAIAAELEGSVTYNPPEDNEMEETQWTMLMN